MIATAASKIKSRICAVINMFSSVWFIDGLLFPNNVSSRCPAIVCG